MNAAIPDQAYLELAKSYDAVYGGFGNAPKFPSAHTFMFLLRYWKRTGKAEAPAMVEKSLQAMRLGGIYDQIGYGFHRYATDRQWLTPHFEKMLYDQAMLVLVYLETYQATGNPFYARTAEEIFSYVLRDMQAPRGGFYSAEDADSEGREGKFYLWKEEEIREALGKEEAEPVVEAFHITKNGNFQEPMGSNEGENILHRAQSVGAQNSGAPDSDFENRLAAAGRKLFETREKRIHPHKDDKVLTDWNGLMIAALARGSQVLGKKEYGTAARRALDFIWKHMRLADGRLLHRYRDGDAAIPALLDDYAFLVWGLLELYEADFEAIDLEKALALNEIMLNYFWDPDKGGLFFAPHDAGDLLVRKKEIYDGAIPAGNSVALMNLLRLGRMTGRTDLTEKAATLIGSSAGSVSQYPAGHTHFLSAYDFAVSPGCELVIAGFGQSRDTQEMLAKARNPFVPNKVILLRDLDQSQPEIDRIIPGLKSYISLDARATAYVCREQTCQKPTTDAAEMLSLLQA
ncbi:MAG: thioredoxin domain-containing protein, partial [Desulfobacteraceae bacterium]